jgi:hypothetical protein
MKKTVTILSVLFVFADLQAQKKDLIGLWDFAEDKLIIEFTENKTGKYGSEMIEYKIVDDEIMRVFN